MTEENDSLDEEAITQFVIEAPEGETIDNSKTLKLVIEGHRLVIAATAEIVIRFLEQAFGAEIVGLNDGAGNDLRPDVIDPLSAGDDSV